MYDRLEFGQLKTSKLSLSLIKLPIVQHTDTNEVYNPVNNTPHLG